MDKQGIDVNLHTVPNFFENKSASMLDGVQRRDVLSSTSFSVPASPPVETCRESSTGCINDLIYVERAVGGC